MTTKKALVIASGYFHLNSFSPHSICNRNCIQREIGLLTTECSHSGEGKNVIRFFSVSKQNGSGSGFIEKHPLFSYRTMGHVCIFLGCCLFWAFIDLILHLTILIKISLGMTPELSLQILPCSECDRSFPSEQ